MTHQSNTAGSSDENSDIRQVIVGSTQMYAAPTSIGELQNEALFGEEVEVHKRVGPFIKVTTLRDGYPGYILESTVSKELHRPTHWVCKPSIFATSGHAARTPGIQTKLGMNARVSFIRERDGKVEIHRLGWVVADQIAPLAYVEPDPIAVALRHVDAVLYGWGQRGADGVDCSAFVQRVCFACGKSCRRDTYQQREDLGVPVHLNSLEDLSGADFVFWDDHVAMMVNKEEVVHSTEFYMRVVREPLTQVIERKGRPIAARRFSDYRPTYR